MPAQSPRSQNEAASLSIPVALPRGQLAFGFHTSNGGTVPTDTHVGTTEPLRGQLRGRVACLLASPKVGRRKGMNSEGFGFGSVGKDSRPGHTVGEIQDEPDEDFGRTS